MFMRDTLSLTLDVPGRFVSHSEVLRKREESRHRPAELLIPTAVSAERRPESQRRCCHAVDCSSAAFEKEKNTPINQADSIHLRNKTSHRYKVGPTLFGAWAPCGQNVVHCVEKFGPGPVDDIGSPCYRKEGFEGMGRRQKRLIKNL